MVSSDSFQCPIWELKRRTSEIEAKGLSGKIGFGKKVFETMKECKLEKTVSIEGIILAVGSEYCSRCKETVSYDLRPRLP